MAQTAPTIFARINLPALAAFLLGLLLLPLAGSSGRFDGNLLWFTLALITPALVLALFLPLMTWWTFACMRPRGESYRYQCPSLQRQLIVAIQMHMQDSEGKLPDSLTILPLTDRYMTCPERKGFHSIGYNRTVAGKVPQEFADIPGTLVTADCRNPDQAINSMRDIDTRRREKPLPEYYWPSRRARPRYYYAGFLDGHVELVQPNAKVDFGTIAGPRMPLPPF